MLSSESTSSVSKHAFREKQGLQMTLTWKTCSAFSYCFNTCCKLTYVKPTSQNAYGKYADWQMPILLGPCKGSQMMENFNQQ